MVPKEMGRKRKHNKNYPQHLHTKKGWFYYVAYLSHTDNPNIKTPKWLPLKTQDEATALKRWAEIESAFVKEKNHFNSTKIMEDVDVADLSEVQINSLRVTQVADWVIETLKIGKLNKIQRLHKSNFEDAFPKQGRKHALTKYDKPGAAPSRVNKTSIRLHN